MNRYKTQGWKNDNYRHSLAARGLTRTSFALTRQQRQFIGDYPEIKESLYGRTLESVPNKTDLRKKSIGDFESVNKDSGLIDERLKEINESSLRNDLDQDEAMAIIFAAQRANRVDKEMSQMEKNIMRDKRYNSEYIKNYKELKALEEEKSSVSERGAFAALPYPDEADAPPLKNFLHQAMQDSFDYMARPNDSISTANPLSSSIKEAWSDWFKAPRQQQKEVLIGGRADGIPDEAFDPKSLKKGIEHEMEHTSNPEIADEIAKDHLVDNPQEYDNGYAK